MKKRLNLLSIVKDCNFENLIEEVSDLCYSYNGINEDVYFYEETKYKGYDIEINGKCSVLVTGKVNTYHDAPDEFWATSKNITIEFGEINVWKNDKKIDVIFDKEHQASTLIENFIKQYI